MGSGWQFVVVGYSALFCQPASFSFSSSSAPFVDDDAAEKTALRRWHRGRPPFSTISPLRDQLLAGEIRRVGNAVNGRWAADLMLCQAGASTQSRPDTAALPGQAGQRDELDSDAGMRQANRLSTSH